MKVTERITEAWKVINSIDDWNDESFDWNEAYVASIFSKVAALYLE